MAKVHKVSMFVIDIEEDCNLEDSIKYSLQRYDLYPEFIEVKSSEEFEWDNDLAINKTDCTKKDFKEYFK